jgi:hypothetical protein
LIREALYEGVPSLRRGRLHRQVGEVLAALTVPDPDIVAYHFQTGGDPRAVEWLLKAGERAQRAYAWVTAVERFEAALAKLTEHGAPATERAVLLYRIAYLRRYMNPRQTVALMEEARQLAIEAGEPALAAQCLHDSGISRFSNGDVARGLAAMEQAGSDYNALPPPEQARLWTVLGIGPDAFSGTFVFCLAQIGRFEDAARLGQRLIMDMPTPSVRVGQGDPGTLMPSVGWRLSPCSGGSPSRRAVSSSSPARSTRRSSITTCWQKSAEWNSNGSSCPTSRRIRRHDGD